MKEVYDPLSAFVFGDGKVFGVLTYNGTQLWFFNPEFNPSDDIIDTEYFIAFEEGKRQRRRLRGPSSKKS